MKIEESLGDMNGVFSWLFFVYSQQVKSVYSQVSSSRFPESLSLAVLIKALLVFTCLVNRRAKSFFHPKQQVRTGR
jgi:hypothetical protein